MAALAWVAALFLAAQTADREPPPEPSFREAPVARFELPDFPSPLTEHSEADPRFGAALRSLALPGWGQQVQGRAHWWIFPVIESVGWAGWIQARREGDRFRERYRDLAWDTARRSIWDGPRVDGPWEYYERMLRWRASGAFDRAPGLPELLPEEDPATFNGSIWSLARAIHLGGRTDVAPNDPAYLQALEYYRGRAVPPELAWDWDGDEEARLRFGALVRESDDAFRRATAFVGLVLVNHFAAAVEAWVAEHPGPLENVPFRLIGRAQPGDRTGEWTLRVDLQRRWRGGGTP